MTSLILDTANRTIFPAIWIFSLYLLFAGHNAPGGGFVGGLVGGAALVLRYVARGTAAGLSLIVLRPASLLGLGLLVAALTGAGSWLAGAQFLTSAKFETEVAVLGTVKVTTSLLFDLGVYLVVIGLVLSLLVWLGREETQP